MLPGGAAVALGRNRGAPPGQPVGGRPASNAVASRNAFRAERPIVTAMAENDVWPSRRLLQRLGIIAEFGFAIVLLGCAIYVGTKSWRVERSAAPLERRQRIARGAFVVRDLNGLDARGRRVFVRRPRPSDRLCIFVVPAERTTSNCQFWNGVHRALIQAGTNVSLVGFCAQPGCCSGGMASFSVLSYAEPNWTTRAGRC